MLVLEEANGLGLKVLMDYPCYTGWRNLILLDSASSICNRESCSSISDHSSPCPDRPPLELKLKQFLNLLSHQASLLHSAHALYVVQRTRCQNAVSQHADSELSDAWSLLRSTSVSPNQIESSIAWNRTSPRGPGLVLLQLLRIRS